LFTSAQRHRPVIGAGIAGAIRDAFGFEPSASAMTARDLPDARSGNPYPVAQGAGASVQLCVLHAPARQPRLDDLQAGRRPIEIVMSFVS